MSSRACHRFASLALAGLITLLVPAAPALAQKRANTLRYRELEWTWGYDPITAKTNTQKRLSQLLYSGVTREVGRLAFAADLHMPGPGADFPLPVEGDEGYTVEIHLRRGVRWARDMDLNKLDDAPKLLRRPLLAADVVATIRAILNKETASYAYPEMGEYIKLVNGEVQYDLTRGDANKWDKLVLRFQRPVQGNAPYLLSFKILPARLLEETHGVVRPGARIGQPGVLLGTGPYWLDMVNKSEHALTFSARDDYYIGRPNIRRIQMKYDPDPALIAIAIQGEQAELAPEIPFSAVQRLLDDKQKYDSVQYASFNFLYVGGNYMCENRKKRTFIRDIRFREALGLATTMALREQMIDAGYAGQGAPFHDFFGPNAIYDDAFHAPEMSEHERKTRIKELLDACGYKGANKVTFQLKYKTGRENDRGNVAMADCFVRNANLHGILMIKAHVPVANNRWNIEIRKKRKFQFILDTYNYGQGYNLEPFFLGKQTVLGFNSQQGLMDALGMQFADFRKKKSPTEHKADLRAIVQTALEHHAVICIGSLKKTAIWRKTLDIDPKRLTSEYFFNDVQDWKWK